MVTSWWLPIITICSSARGVVRQEAEERAAPKFKHNGLSSPGLHHDLKTSDNMTYVSHLLDDLLIGYDRNLRPTAGMTVVEVDLIVRSIGPVSEADQTFALNVYFRQRWFDPRLEHTASSKALSVSNSFLSNIWRPDTHFVNSLKSYLHSITVPNTFLRIYPDGTVYYSMRLTMTATCPMQLHNFPMDTQNCPLTIASISYSPSEVSYMWLSDLSVNVTEGLELSQYDLIGIPRTSNRSQIVNSFEFTDERDLLRSTLSVHFKIQRRVGHFLINLYIPCSLLVVISWVAFWLNREATADRINLGVTTVLTLVLLVLDSRQALPKVTYATALDEFVMWCFTFVFASLLEFAAVHINTKISTADQEVVRMVRFGETNNFPEEVKLAWRRRHPDVRIGVLENIHAKWEESTPLRRHTNASPESVRNSRRNNTDSPHRVTWAINGCESSDEDLQPQTVIASSSQQDKNEELTGGFTKIQFWRCIYALKYLPKKLCHYLHGCMFVQGKYADFGPFSYGAVNSDSKIDRVARVVFPFTFTLFQVYYWTKLVTQNADDMVNVVHEF